MNNSNQSQNILKKSVFPFGVITPRDKDQEIIILYFAGTIFMTF